MKAAFTLIPSESRRLIAKAVAQMDEIASARKEGYIIISGGTTNYYVAQEIAGLKDLSPEKFTVGISSHRLLCVISDEARRKSLPLILYKGARSTKTIKEALEDFHRETIIIKGACAIDHEGNVGVILGGFDGGTAGATIGTVVSQGLKYIVPVGLEKMVSSVREAVEWTGAKTLDYSLGADFGIIQLPHAVVVTEIQALKILTGVEAVHVASGGVGESAGAVVLVIRGDEGQVKKAISLIESIKGEPRIPGAKANCEVCRYACRFAHTRKEDLPEWLKD
jgi:hypothetical protein